MKKCFALTLAGFLALSLMGCSTPQVSATPTLPAASPSPEVPPAPSQTQAPESQVSEFFALIKANQGGTLTVDEAMYFGPDDKALAGEYGIEDYSGYAYTNPEENPVTYPVTEGEFSVVRRFASGEVGARCTITLSELEGFLAAQGETAAWVTVTDGVVTAINQPDPIGLNMSASTDGSATYLAYVYLLNARTVEIDHVLWIDGSDTESLNYYGIDPEEVTNDYAIVNESELRDKHPLLSAATFFVQFSDDMMEIQPREVDFDSFQSYMLCRDYGILAEVTETTSGIARIEEIYTP